MRALTIITAAVALFGVAATPAMAGERDAMVVSVVVLPSCTVASEHEADAFVPQVWCNTDASAPRGEPASGEPAERAFAPAVETFEGPLGAIVRVTY
jgi:hypothetical protein